MADTETAGLDPLASHGPDLGMTYNKLLDAAISGKLAAKRIRGRWYTSKEAVERFERERNAA